MMYIIMLISWLLVGLVYIIFLMLNIKKTLDLEEVSPYECGFDPSSSARVNFSYRFFLVAILFIVFDVEISLLLPVPFIMKSEFGLWIFITFMMILIVGLVYEYFCGSLDWMETVILY